LLSDDQEPWKPRGAPEPKPQELNRRHPNYWFGWLGVATGWTFLGIFDPWQALRFHPYEEGLGLFTEGSGGVLGLLSGMLFASHLFALRPHVTFDDAGVEIRNPLTIWRLGWGAIVATDDIMGFPRLRLTDGRKVICWGLEEYMIYDPPQKDALIQGAEGKGSRRDRKINRTWHPPHWFDIASFALLLAYMTLGVVRV